MKVPVLDLKRQYEPIRKEILQAMERVFDSGQYILGDDVTKLEKEAGSYVGADHAIGVSSGTDALWLALRALDIGPGDKVLTSPFTFFATVSAIAGVGAEPVFADIRPDTFNIDPRKVEEALLRDTERKIKAIIAVHLYGQAAEMNDICALAKRHGIPVVEDAAQAFGTRYQGRGVGSLGALACFSFFPTKNLGGLGDGGLVSTNDAALAEKVRVLRAHGSKQKYYHLHLGSNCRLDTLQASIIRVMLPHLDGWIKARRECASYYDEKLAKVSAVKTPGYSPDSNHTFHQYTIRVTKGQRENLRAYLNECGIGNAVYYPVPCHRQEALKNFNLPVDAYPESDRAAAEAISLPIFPAITKEEMDAVVNTIAGWAGRN